MIQCEEFANCRDRRVADAERWGKVLQKLETIDSNISALWREIKDQREDSDKDRRDIDKDFRNIYFKMGAMSGTISLIVSIVFALINGGFSK